VQEYLSKEQKRADYARISRIIVSTGSYAPSSRMTLTSSQKVSNVKTSRVE
jgi:hypothetical protein